MNLLSPSLSWQFRSTCPLAPHELLVSSGDSSESAGASSLELDRMARLVTRAEWQQMRGDGLPLTAIERAVYHLVRSQLGHGAFAAAAVRLIQTAPSKWPCNKLRRAHDLDAIGSGGAVVGQLQDRISGPPVVMLGESDELVDALLLTWHGQWRADRCVLRLDFIRRGERDFREAFASHPREVTSILGEDATRLLGNWRCAN